MVYKEKATEFQAQAIASMVQSSEMTIGNKDARTKLCEQEDGRKECLIG